MSDEKPAAPYDDDFSGHFKKIHRRPRYWGPRLIAVLVPALCTAFSSYYKSKEKSEAGYRTLVDAVLESQKSLRELEEAVNKLQAEHDRDIEKLQRRRPPEESRGPASATPPRPFVVKLKLMKPAALPMDLDKAQQMQQQKQAAPNMAAP